MINITLPTEYSRRPLNISTQGDVDKYLFAVLGPRRKDIGSAVALTIAYCVIFLSGTAGNLCTFIVILKNSYMQTSTNYYIANLAIADLLTLLIALPPELYMVWESYPWRFGEVFCFVKTFLFEVMYNASVLTITVFTIERYISICHPVRAQSILAVNRAIVIVSTWITASICALPYPVFTRVFYYLTYPGTDENIPESLQCNIPREWQDQLKFLFQISAFLFFVAPMVLIILLYILIGLNIGGPETCRSSVLLGDQNPAILRAKKAVIKMLVAVVVAFFFCWAPFHAQRLMTLYVKSWNRELLSIQSHLFYISGILYFFNSTVNPILYNLLSRKFRQAFKRTLCRRLCVSVEGLPVFYRFQAKYVRRQGNGTQSQLQRQERPIVMATLKKDLIQNKVLHYHRTTSNDTYLPAMSTGYGEFLSPSNTIHVHSDSRLHEKCRYRNCSCNQRAMSGSRLKLKDGQKGNKFYASFSSDKTNPCDVLRCKNELEQNSNCNYPRDSKNNISLDGCVLNFYNDCLTEKSTSKYD